MTDPASAPHEAQQLERSGARDRLLENEFIGRAQHLARLSAGSFRTHVEVRLRFGEAEYGDTWRERPTADLIAEAADEAADLVAWLTLAAQSLAPEMHPETASTVRESMARAAAGAVEAYAWLSAVLEEVDRS